MVESTDHLFIGMKWVKNKNKKYLEPDLVRKTTNVVKKIYQRMMVAQSRQKIDVDNMRKPLKFEISDKVFLKVAPMKGVMRFGKKDKLSTRYIGPYEILDKIEDVAYRLALSPTLAKVHNVFHVSILRKYISDPSHVLEEQPIEFDKKLTYEGWVT